MIAVAFALPQESQDFRRALRASHVRLGTEEIKVLHLGVGPAAAAASAARSLAGDRPRFFICAGYAGGLDPRLGVGDLIVAENFSAPELVSRCRQQMTQAGGCYFGTLISLAWPVETVAAKARLADEKSALAVDMETEEVASACRSAGVPLLAIRVISDPASVPLPVPFEEWFDMARQGPRRLRLLRFLVSHPSRIGAFAAFVRGLTPARRALTECLLRVLKSP